MKIISWSKDRIRENMWSAPAWVKEALEAGIAFAYLLVDEKEEKVAAWGACYIEEDHLEIISLGQEQNIKQWHSLERILRKLQSFCLERNIKMSEIELIGEADIECQRALVRSDYVKIMDSILWSVKSQSVKTVGKGSFDIKRLGDLSPKEKASFIQIFKSTDKNIPQFSGSISPELMLTALKDGRVEACIFASRYRGALFIEQLVYKNVEAGQEVLGAMCRLADKNKVDENLYVTDLIYDERIFGKGQMIAKQVYAWKLLKKAELTAMEAEAELAVREDRTDVMSPLLLAKVYAVADMFTSQEVENYLGLDQDMQPKLIAIIRGISGEYIMDVRPLADDIDFGWIRYEITTSFSCEKSGGDAVSLCSSLNELIKEGTVYIKETNKLVLRTHISETAIMESQTFNWLLHNWYESCQYIAGTGVKKRL